MRTGLSHLLSVILICSLGFIAYSNTFHCSYHFDDEFLLLDNVSLRNIANLKGYLGFSALPLYLLSSLALNYHFHQFDVYGYHVVNLALHLVSAIMVWWLALLTLSTPAIKKRPKKTLGKKSLLDQSCFRNNLRKRFRHNSSLFWQG